MTIRFKKGLWVAIWFLLSSPAAFACTLAGTIGGPIDPLGRTKDMVRDYRGP